MDFDLNIENYTLPDLLALFNLTTNFNESELKQAKKHVFKLHPDKSNLPKDYFIFYAKAYKYIYSIHEFKTRGKDTTTDYSDHIQNEEKDKSTILKKMNEQEDFNQWFNTMFDKYSLGDEEDGYEEWLKKEESSTFQANNLSQLQNEFDKFKQHAIKDIVVHKEIQDVCNNLSSGGSNIRRGRIDDYSSSDIFNSSLQYNDVKRAHTETFIPVTDEDFNNRKKYNNIFEMKLDRDNQKMVLPTMEESNRTIKSKRDNEESIATQDAYKLLKHQEEQEKMDALFWKNLRLLK
jgi:hypothetical protein